jgi:hypothetical protein
VGLLDRDEGSDGAGEWAALLCEGGLCFRFLVGGPLILLEGVESSGWTSIEKNK